MAQLIWTKTLAATLFLFRHTHALQTIGQSASAEKPDLMSPFLESHSPRGDTAKPRMLVMRGCSGSSAIMLLARSLLRLHGIPVPSAFTPKWDEHGKVVPPPVLKNQVQSWPAEMLKPSINWMYEEAGKDIGKAMLLADRKIRTFNQTLFFKGMAQEIAENKTWTSLKQPFSDMRVVAVFSARENMLDQLVCQIKDCFHVEYGYPVNTRTGERSDLCFNRRNKAIVHSESEASPSTFLRVYQKASSIFGVVREWFSSAEGYKANGGYKANIDIANLTANIKEEIKILEKARQNMKGTVPFLEVSEEDLLEFQTDIPGAFDRGVRAWGTLLTSFRVEPDIHAISDFLRKFTNTYPRDPPHKNLIYNWRDVKEALQGTGYEHYWRDSD